MEFYPQETWMRMWGRVDRSCPHLDWMRTIVDRESVGWWEGPECGFSNLRMITTDGRTRDVASSVPPLPNDPRTVGWTVSRRRTFDTDPSDSRSDSRARAEAGSPLSVDTVCVVCPTACPVRNEKRSR
eukprot:Polyplicarium_translucidae@DN3346_c0_g4_i1.p1